MLEEMDVLFGGVSHIEKGGAQLGVEDTHHAHIQHVEGQGEEISEVENQNVVLAEKV